MTAEQLLEKEDQVAEAWTKFEAELHGHGLVFDHHHGEMLVRDAETEEIVSFL